MKDEMLTNPEIINLGEHIQQEIVEWYGSSAKLVSKVPEISIRPYSIFLRYGISTEIEKGHKFILLKIVRRPEMNDFNKIIANNEMRKEGLKTYQSMNRLFALKRSFIKKPFFSILPLAYIKKWNAIVMEEAQQIQDLKTIIGNLFIFPLSLNQNQWDRHKLLFSKVGDWLQSFHSFESNYQEVNFSKHFQMAIFAELSKWEGLGTLPKRVVNMLDEFPPNLTKKKLQIDQIHGDFNLVNIVIDKTGNIGAIDPHSYRMDSIYVDLAHFFVDPLLQKWQVFTGAILLDRKKYREYIELFLKGYFNNKEPDYQILNAYVCIELLKKWRMNEEKFLSKQGNQIFWSSLKKINQFYFLRKFTIYWNFATNNRQQ